MANEQTGRKKPEEAEVNSQPKSGQPLTADQQENWKKWSKLVVQVWADEKLKQRLLENPAALLQEHGIAVPAGMEVRVVENTDKVSYLILPPKLSDSELTSSQLQGIVGGTAVEYDARAALLWLYKAWWGG